MLGLQPYRLMHELDYLDLSDTPREELAERLSSAPIRQPVILPRDCYAMAIGTDVADRSMALVGNGRIEGRGAAIDGHDIVVRTNALYNWKRSAEHDGERFDWWMGRGGMDMLDPAAHLESGHPTPVHLLGDALDSLKVIASTVHTNLEAGFVAEMMRRNALDRYTALLSTPYVFELIDRESFFLQKRAFIEICAGRRYHHVETWWGGLYGFELLFTGVAIAIRLALMRPKSLTLYGFDFYHSTTYRPWDMHDVTSSREALRLCGEFCASEGIGFEVVRG